MTISEQVRAERMVSIMNRLRHKYMQVPGIDDVAVICPKDPDRTTLMESSIEIAAVLASSKNKHSLHLFHLIKGEETLKEEVFTFTTMKGCYVNWFYFGTMKSYDFGHLLPIDIQVYEEFHNGHKGDSALNVAMSHRVKLILPTVTNQAFGPMDNLSHVEHSFAVIS